MEHETLKRILAEIFRISRKSFREIGKSGNREIGKTRILKFPDFSWRNYKRKFRKSNTPPFDFATKSGNLVAEILRNPKKFSGNREIGKSGKLGFWNFRIFHEEIIKGNFGNPIPPRLISPWNLEFWGFTEKSKGGYWISEISFYNFFMKNLEISEIVDFLES